MYSSVYRYQEFIIQTLTTENEPEFMVQTYITPVHNINMAVSLLILVNLRWYAWNSFDRFVETDE